MKKFIHIATILCLPAFAFCQTTPLKGVYFKNSYLVNPAMAGSEPKARVFLNYSSQWNKIEGSPTLMSLSASTPINESMGVGVNVISDKAGLMQRMQAMGSFAYKLEVGDEQSVRFGLSAAWTRQQINTGSATVNGSPDVALSNYNDKQKSVLDGNVGIAYVGSGVEAQFSYLNLNQKRAAEFSTVDYSIFYSSVSYTFNREGMLNVKPLVAFRGIKGYTHQWDVASQFTYNQMVDLYTMYHSNQSFSAGAGYTFQEKLHFSVIYNSEPNKVRGYTGGILDLMLGFNF